MAITRYSPARVTIGLSIAGAVCGAGAGVIALAVAAVFSRDVLLLGGFRGLAGIPLVIGSVLGAICAPLAGWLGLRHVPLGSMFLGLSLGTILGGVTGWFAPQFGNVLVQPVVAAAGGFLAAAVALRLWFRRRAASTPDAEVRRLTRA